MKTFTVEQVGPAFFVFATEGERAARIAGPFRSGKHAKQVRVDVEHIYTVLTFGAAFALGQLYSGKTITDQQSSVELGAMNLIEHRLSPPRWELTPLGRSVALALAFEAKLPGETAS